MITHGFFTPGMHAILLDSMRAFSDLLVWIAFPKYTCLQFHHHIYHQVITNIGGESCPSQLIRFNNLNCTCHKRNSLFVDNENFMVQIFGLSEGAVCLVGSRLTCMGTGESAFLIQGTGNLSKVDWTVLGSWSHTKRIPEVEQFQDEIIQLLKESLERSTFLLFIFHLQLGLLWWSQDGCSSSKDRIEMIRFRGRKRTLAF